MRLEEQILVNKYAQGLVDISELLNMFLSLTLNVKQSFLKNIIVLINQSKPTEEDIKPAIDESKLKSTFTPCVLLRKGIENHHLQKIAELPDSELGKALVLLLSLFKIAYLRRFELEKNNPYKWWYWDLSDETKIKQIMNKDI
jgi:hypothetical protein